MPDALHIVSLSGGAASIVAADRVIERYGREHVILWFANTLWEDEDLYRCLDDCMARWGGTLETYTDGRTPLQVAEAKRLIPNNLHAPCSLVLKIEPFGKRLQRLLTEHDGPVVVHLGLGPHEPKRLVRPKERWEGMSPRVTVEFPLCWKGYTQSRDGATEERMLLRTIESWGITPPRLYALGWHHNNCGARCIRGGKGSWQNLDTHFPERYTEVMEWEEAQQAKGGARTGHTILREQRNGERVQVSLRTLRERGTS